MNFYQQKYFKPYHEIVKTPEQYTDREFGTPSTHYRRYKQKIQYSDRLNAEPIWEYLYSEGMKSQKQLQQRHQATKHKIDIQCTFKPLIKESKRYLVPPHSTFMERNTVWMENKIQKIVKQKQQQINKGLKQCTFAPHINKQSRKYRVEKYHDNVHKKKCPNERLHKSAIKFNPRVENQQNVQPPRKTSYLQVSRAKQMIKDEIKRLIL